MKRTSLLSLATSSLMLAALVPSLSHATDGVVNFSGSITDVTCNINGNAPGENNITNVELGRISPSVFKAIGNASPFKSFQLVLSGAQCTDGTKVVVDFDQVGNVDVATGNLKLIGSAPATGVQIQVYNDDVADGTKVPLGQSETTPQVATVAGNTATLKFKANYVATAASVGPGSGNSFVRYTLSYK
ncbi:fimbrial protein [Pseudomonas chlororaphis]|uniref:fimbrial protein n=1 Tax=Pseudomonas chlororaphis TaxID=587753 RepID=UPI0006A62D95|nr:fimbrial protein [Pseudomonas chlororaphis]AZD00722.1 P pilus assembly protein, pilin FimA [Pseudomonas chlororaphis subsp. chlororaphis]MBM0283380.1 type 1 fimbrial protein [Pseudomonas chlororaphis]MDO1503707.1 type 1 fimbrial protein [Pseudomonas chlororaphis]ORM48775.1 fimbrial protein [Pseudomonas chlororaphis subsp. chlororaphis]TWR95128.1 type 1 fimbrial protein [Pseudomonas chlororaphis subsp. chlororaphis]